MHVVRVHRGPPVPVTPRANDSRILGGRLGAGHGSGDEHECERGEVAHGGAWGTRSESEGPGRAHHVM